MVVTFIVVAIMLVVVLVGSTIRQQRRYLHTRGHLGGRLLTAQDEERAVIARELHDDVVQSIATLRTQVQLGEVSDPIEIAARLDRIANDLRNLARGMHPTLVDQLGLDAALRELASSIGAREEMVIEYVGQSEQDDLTPAQRLALYRVAQEALGNVAHHAGVRHARMHLTHDRGGTQLVIADTGKGFDPRVAASGRGIGVTSMRERLDILGGTLEVDGSPGRGTKVTALLPGNRPAT